MKANAYYIRDYFITDLLVNDQHGSFKLVSEYNHNFYLRFYTQMVQNNLTDYKMQQLCTVKTAVVSYSVAF